MRARGGVVFFFERGEGGGEPLAGGLFAGEVGDEVLDVGCELFLPRAVRVDLGGAGFVELGGAFEVFC